LVDTLEETDTTDVGSWQRIHIIQLNFDRQYSNQKFPHCQISPGVRLVITNRITRPAPTMKVSPHPSLANKGSPKLTVKIPARKPSVENAKL
jgi:hypothetical protein